MTTRFVHMRAKNETMCSCSRACSIDSVHANETTYVFYTDDNTPRLSRAYLGLAVLEKNSVYRMHDLLVHSGARFRRDSISVLCEPLYRGTLLREVLATTSFLDGVLLSSRAAGGDGSGGMQVINSEKLEMLVTVRSDDYLENLPLLPLGQQPRKVY